jgi:hypothetical protein
MADRVHVNATPIPDDAINGGHRFSGDIYLSRAAMWHPRSAERGRVE